MSTDKKGLTRGDYWECGWGALSSFLICSKALSPLREAEVWPVAGGFRSTFDNQADFRIGVDIRVSERKQTYMKKVSKTVPKSWNNFKTIMGRAVFLVLAARKNLKSQNFCFNSRNNITPQILGKRRHAITSIFAQATFYFYRFWRSGLLIFDEIRTQDTVPLPVLRMWHCFWRLYISIFWFFFFA